MSAGLDIRVVQVWSPTEIPDWAWMMMMPSRENQGIIHCFAFQFREASDKDWKWVRFEKLSEVNILEVPLQFMRDLK